MRDRAAFDAVTAELAARRVYDDTLWAYALVHHDRRRYAEWLAHRDELLVDVGPLALTTGPVDPVDRGTAEHLEYAPLVNARAHRLGEHQRIPNEGLAAQWTRFLERTARHATVSPADRLAAAHYLFTMDRPDDAVRSLGRAPRDRVRAGLQHDYVSAYAAASTGDLAEARARSAPHVAHPVDRWRHRFAALSAMLDEVEGRGPAVSADPDRRDARMDELAAQQPTLAARMEDGSVVLEHARLEVAELRFYKMDVELLFSRQPFLSADVDRFTFIEPTDRRSADLDPSGRTRVPLPDALRRADLVIEVRGGPVRAVVTHYANDLQVSVAAPYGQVQVRRASTGSALSATYVKAFARTKDGAVQLYKDGYTDLRGRLDYATLSTDDLDRVDRFALLVLHDDAGAVVVEATPPLR
jgi:hypothetical protein